MRKHIRKHTHTQAENAIRNNLTGWGYLCALATFTFQMNVQPQSHTSSGTTGRLRYIQKSYTVPMLRRCFRESVPVVVSHTPQEAVSDPQEAGNLQPVLLQLMPWWDSLVIIKNANIKLAAVSGRLGV